jgi:putative SOS response-associated peptidase YedK
MCNFYDIGPARQRRGNDWEEVIASLGGSLARTYGIRKTDPAPVLRRVGASGSQETFAGLMRWGFERDFNPAVNNARLDKLEGPWAPAWREKRRCLIPLSAWYEWHGPSGSKQTFAFESPDGAWLWAAGLWEEGKSSPSFSMITRPAAPDLAFVHDRMPALLSVADFEAFLSNEDPRELLATTEVPVKVFRCHSPLLKIALHRGPEPIEMLPGF